MLKAPPPVPTRASKKAAKAGQGEEDAEPSPLQVPYTLHMSPGVVIGSHVSPFFSHFSRTHSHTLVTNVHSTGPAACIYCVSLHAWCAWVGLQQAAIRQHAETLCARRDDIHNRIPFELSPWHEDFVGATRDLGAQLYISQVGARPDQHLYETCVTEDQTSVWTTMCSRAVRVALALTCTALFLLRNPVGQPQPLVLEIQRRLWSLTDVRFGRLEEVRAWLCCVCVYLENDIFRGKPGEGYRITTSGLFLLFRLRMDTHTNTQTRSTYACKPIAGRAPFLTCALHRNGPRPWRRAGCQATEGADHAAGGGAGHCRPAAQDRLHGLCRQVR